MILRFLGFEIWQYYFWNTLFFMKELSLFISQTRSIKSFMINLRQFQYVFRRSWIIFKKLSFFAYRQRPTIDP
jgi:hypothetical protein